MTATRTSRTYLSAPHPRYARFLTQRLGGAIDSLYIMPVANSVRSHRESIAREMRLFHGENGAAQRARRRGRAAPRRAALHPLHSARCNDDARAPRALRHVCMRCVYTEKGLTALCHRGISWVGVQTLLCPTRACTLASEIFFFSSPDVRVEAMIFSVL